VNANSETHRRRNRRRGRILDAEPATSARFRSMGARGNAPEIGGSRLDVMALTISAPNSSQGRPLWLRALERSAPEQLQALAAAGVLVRTAHRQAPSRMVRTGCAGWRRAACFRPDGYEVILGNGGSAAIWDAAAIRTDRQALAHTDLRRIQRQSLRSGGQTVRGETDRDQGGPGTAPKPPSDPSVRRGRVAHNETSKGASSRCSAPQGMRWWSSTPRRRAGGRPSITEPPNVLLATRRN